MRTAHANRAERAWVVAVRTVVMVILDSRRWTSTEIRCVKTLTIVVIVRLFEQWRRVASENPRWAIRVEELVLNVFVGESGDRFISPHRQRRGTFPKHDHHICFDSDC